MIFRALAARITELENKMYSLELAHVTDTFKKECELPTEASKCCDSHTDGREADQLLDTIQLCDHNHTTDVV